ncbi:unnamed protein product [Paramecium sonneborni]|uniref:Uncharacterized protein n=1 Tax=Paramecium sonneborni TaxID=65129 RepID=A0A8S1NQ01_9CILI|nr:unnamed protein product [Paramecium sonneborni]
MKKLKKQQLQKRCFTKQQDNVEQQAKQQERHLLLYFFNNTQQIKVSNEGKKIKIWEFYQERLKLLKVIKACNNTINCLVNSKQSNNFNRVLEIIPSIAGNINESNWKPYKKFEQNKAFFFACLILNEQKDQLISCGCDNSGKVWKINFMNQNLDFLFIETKWRLVVSTIKSYGKKAHMVYRCDDQKKQ